MLDVAIDHGMFGEHPFLTGIENMPEAVAVVATASPDAVQLSPGQAPLLQSIPGRGRPALVLRCDVANAYGNPLDEYLFSLHFPDAVETAIRHDAACVVVNLLHLPGRPEIRERCISSIMALKAECERYRMPLMVEPLVMADADKGGYMVNGDTAKIVALVRQARELGADIIKADPTDRVEDYHQVVEAGVVPVLVRGGGRVEDRLLLERTAAVLGQGAAGIVYGRNIVQHPHPHAVVAALMAMLHDGADVDAAHAILVEASGQDPVLDGAVPGAGR